MAYVKRIVCLANSFKPGGSCIAGREVIGNGFGGWGFIVNYRDKKFYAEPYYSTDVIIPDEPKPVFNLVYQNLTLDKPVYNVGDSLYGKVSFKSIETDHDGSKIDHSGEGYFRAVVTRR